MAGLFTPRQDKRLLMLPPDALRPNPRQPRTQFDDNELESLGESIRKNGIIQPLTVRRLKNGGYELISGERRLRAARLLKLSQVPCLILEADDCRSSVLSLVENLQRQDLSCFEEAEGIYRLMKEFGFSQQEVAQKLGMSQSALSNKLRLLRLTKEQRESIANARLTERHARALLRLPTDDQRDEVLAEIIVKGYNVEETDRYIDKLLTPPKPQPRKTAIVRDIRLFVNSINRAVDVMRMSGVNAETERIDTEQYIQYTVKIPK